MADIPSLGIDLFDIVDPGLTNIEEQAYPRPLDPAQALAQQLARLLDASLFAPNGPPPLLQAGPIPSFQQVESQAARPPSFSLGVAAVVPPTFDAGAFAIPRPAAEVIVTPVGNFQTNITPSDVVSFTIASVVTINGTLAPRRFFQLFFPAGTNLFSLGIDLFGRNVFLPSQAPALDPQDVPTRIIVNYSTNFIIVAETETDDAGNSTVLPSAPIAGQIVRLDNFRDGFEVNFNFTGQEIDVTIAPAPAVAQTVVGDSRRVVNVFATDGVVQSFVGAGQRIPLLLFQNLRETAFFPSDQGILTRGLPVNVNVG